MKISDVTRTDEQGTYAKLVPSRESKNKILDAASKINIENLVGARSLHTTVIYSRVDCGHIPEEVCELPMSANGSHFDIFDNPDGTKSLVLVLESSEMQSLHSLLKDEYDATHDFPSYQPHITLSYDYSYSTVPSNSILEYLQGLEFDKFIVEPLILNYRPE